ncbi:MAG: E3 binding domain-containing protein [Bifidobacteriaceae bacterium]|jgi:pyruvate dehydrogenase E2 component (dihydrolipoamide acetyltransferase)|nr:E3 binding domain-containing protein [Bifidobacteriaceae bacterium]
MAPDLLTFALPDPGEGLTEAEITRWLVAPGDPVAVNQPVVEIETAKSTVELPSPFDGLVEALAVAEGAVVPVGEAILTVRVPGAGTPAGPGPVLVGYGPGREPAAAIGTGPIGAAGPEGRGGAPVRPGSAVAREDVAARGREPAAAIGTGPISVAGPEGRGCAPARPGSAVTREDVVARGREPAPAIGTIPISDRPPGGRVRAKPPVRALAKQLGVDLRGVAPSGPGGTETREDVAVAAGS